MYHFYYTSGFVYLAPSYTSYNLRFWHIAPSDSDELLIWDSGRIC